MKILIIGPFPPLKAPEADHAFYLAERLADQGSDVHVVTAKGSISTTHHRIRVYPVIQDWSSFDVLRVARVIRRCSPDAVLLVYTVWVYNGHRLITFIPTVSKILLPRVPFVILFEDAPRDSTVRSAPTSLLARALRKGRALSPETLLRRPSLLVRTLRRGIAVGVETLLCRLALILRSLRKGMLPWSGGNDVDYNYGTLLRDSDRIIVVSERARVALARRFVGVNRKSVLIPAPPILRMCPENNGTARQRWRETLDVKPSEFLITYFGYIYPSKGVETLLKAFQIVSSERSNVRLIMVGGNIELNHGSSYMHNIHEMPKQLGIEDKVTWTGEYEWDSEDASGYLRTADVCVFPFDNGISLHNSSFAAAAAHGLPIVTTQGAMLEDPFVHRGNVFLCPPKSPEAMAAAIQTLMDDPELRERLCRGALELAEEWFSWDKAVERTIEALKSS